METLIFYSSFLVVKTLLAPPWGFPAEVGVACNSCIVQLPAPLSKAGVAEDSVRSSTTCVFWQLESMELITSSVPG